MHIVQFDNNIFAPSHDMAQQRHIPHQEDDNDHAEQFADAAEALAAEQEAAMTLEPEQPPAVEQETTPAPTGRGKR